MKFFYKWYILVKEAFLKLHPDFQRLLKVVIGVLLICAIGYFLLFLSALAYWGWPYR